MEEILNIVNNLENEEIDFYDGSEKTIIDFMNYVRTNYVLDRGHKCQYEELIDREIGYDEWYEFVRFSDRRETYDAIENRMSKLWEAWEKEKNHWKSFFGSNKEEGKSV